MSNELASNSSVAVAKDTEANPLLMLPVEWRKTVSFFWMCNEHLLRSPTPICARLKLWIEKDNITIDDVQKAFAKVMTPARCAEIHYAGQLIAALSAEISAITQRKREDENMKRLREEWNASKRESLNVVSDLAERFKAH